MEITMKKSSLAILLIGCTAASWGQGFSTSSFANLNASNGGGYTVLDGGFSDGGPVSGTHSFTGMDHTGATQTMTFTGNAASSSEYGRLHGYSSASLTNSYYNVNNLPYADGNGGVANQNGSPDDLAATTSSFFSDTLQFGGNLQAGYKARYIFHVDGTNSGFPRVQDVGGPLMVLGVTIAGVNTVWGYDGNGSFAADWATADVDINGQTPQEISAQMDTLVSFSPKNLTDGSNVSATCDFSSTATLAAIEVVDANGNVVHDVTWTSASGTIYPVPEPMTFAVLGLGLVGLIRRKRA